MCDNEVCINVGASLDLGIYAYIEAANPTYFEGGFRILGMNVSVSGGKRC
jgi:hypothetical protein